MSLVGLLLVVVILGALSATALVGLRAMTGSNGNNSGVLANATAAGNVANGASGGASANVAAISPVVACKVAADGARSASTLYFTNGGGKYPVRWSDLTAATPPVYKLSSNVVVNAAKPKELDGPGWKLMMSGGGATAPTFTCT